MFQDYKIKLKNVAKNKPVNVVEFENLFIQTSDPSRLGKILAHYELYKMVKDLPGAVVECGVFKANSLVQFATFRNLLEAPHSRKIIGFDTFGKVPDTKYKNDQPYLKQFKGVAGDTALSKNQVEEIFVKKGFKNFELISGDVVETVPKYVKENPHLRISLLHIDTDVYEPAVSILEHLYDRVVKGGVIAFDDYGTFPGESDAVDEFFKDKNVKIKKFSYSHIPSYIIKP
jgi:hypothetical protein